MDREHTHSRDNEHGEHERFTPLDALVVFGVGPVRRADAEHRSESDLPDLDWAQREHEHGSAHVEALRDRLLSVAPYPAGKRVGPVALRLEAKLNTLAAGQLYVEGKVRELIFTGGRTALGNGGEYPSEAELMRDYVLQKFPQIPPAAIRLEDQAQNSIENLAHTFNMIDENPAQYQELGFLASHQHIARIQKLMERFGVASGSYFSSDPIVRRRSQHHETLLNRIHSFKNRRYRQMVEAEVRWSRGLHEIPEYLIPQTAHLEHPARLKQIWRAEAVMALLEAHDVSREEIDALEEIAERNPERFAQIRSQVRGIERRLPPEQWARLPNEYFLARHGNAAHNPSRTGDRVSRWAGQNVDSELTPEGEAEARALAHLVVEHGGVDLIVTSDLTRSRRTGELVAEEIDRMNGGQIPIRSYPELREWNVGEFAGKTRAEVEAEYPGEAAKFYGGELVDFPGGETLDAVTQRVKKVFEELASQDLDQPSARVLIVAHGGFNRVAVSRFLGDQSVPNPTDPHLFFYRFALARDRDEWKPVYIELVEPKKEQR